MRTFKGYIKGVNLGGWLSQCPHTIERYETFITEEDIAKIASWGCDHIRLPVDYELLENHDGVQTEYGISYIQRAVDWCGKHGLNMIIDLHKAPGFFFTHEHNPFFEEESVRERFYKIWERLATAFGKYSDRVAFELLNEITDPSYCDPWNEYSNVAIKRIRAIAPDTYILVGQYWHNSVSTVKHIAPPADDKIVFNFHCYEPMLFTHQGASWTKGMPRDLNMEYPATKEEYIRVSRESGFWSSVNNMPLDALSPEFFEWLFESAIAHAEKHNAPLYCGEYGVFDRADLESELRWYADIHAVFEKYGIGRAAWSYKQMGFGLIGERIEPVQEKLIKLL